MLRACIIPSEEFAQVTLDVVNDCCDKFYKLYEEIFGMENCSYYVHVFLSHLLEIRTHGPLTETSAFKFESFYGEIRRSFVPGTISPLKQILKNIYLKRYLKNHQCKDNIFLSNYDTPLESNKFVYTYNERQHHIYQISEIDGNSLTCNKVGKYQATFAETPHLNWADVGVFKKGDVCSENTMLHTSEIKGKVMIVGKYMMTCPINVLNEK